MSRARRTPVLQLREIERARRHERLGSHVAPLSFVAPSRGAAVVAGVREEAQMKVKDAMAKDPISIDPEAAIGTALDVMRSKHVRHLPVTDDTGQLIGIVTDRDLRQAVFTPFVQEYLSEGARQRAQSLGQTLENLRVRDVMTWVVVTTHPEASLAHAALIMSERRVGSLPVVDGGRLVGLVTEHDVLSALTVQGRIAEFDLDGFLW